MSTYGRLNLFLVSCLDHDKVLADKGCHPTRISSMFYHDENKADRNKACESKAQVTIKRIFFVHAARVSLKAGYRRYTTVFVVTNLPLTAGLQYDA